MAHRKPIAVGIKQEEEQQEKVYDEDAQWADFDHALDNGDFGTVCPPPPALMPLMAHAWPE